MEDRSGQENTNQPELWTTLLLSLGMVASAFVNDAFFPSRGGLSREGSPTLFYAANALFVVFALVAVYRLARSGTTPAVHEDATEPSDSAGAFYRVEISGLAEGTDPAAAAKRLAALLKVDQGRAGKALASLPVTLAKRVDAERADRYRDVLTRNGFLPDIHDLSEHSRPAASKRPVYRIATITLGLSTACLVGVVGFLLLAEPKAASVEVFTVDLPLYEPPEGYACRPRPENFRDLADASDYIDYSDDLRPPGEITDLRALAAKASTVRYQHARADSQRVALHVIDQKNVSLMPRRLSVATSNRPQWLLLSGARLSGSNPSARYAIEVAPGANLERILVDSSVAQVEISDQSLTGSRLDRLLSAWSPSGIAGVEIQQLNLYKLCARRAQKRGSERNDYAIRQWAAATESLLGEPFTTSVILKTAPGPNEIIDIPFKPFTVDKERLQALDARWLYKAAQAEVHDYEIEKDYAVTYQARDDTTSAVAFDSPAALIDMLELYAGRKLIPVAVPSEERFKGSHPDDWIPYFWHLEYTQRNVTKGRKYKCSPNHRTIAGVIRGTIQDDDVECSWGNHFHYLDWGDDSVDDGWGSDIFYGGPGDDVIDVGYGSDIVVYTAGWGTDTLAGTCHNTFVDEQKLAGMNRYYWDPKWRYTKFIVFGQEIKREDIIATPGRLTHRVSGDSITLVGGGQSLCFNLVFWE